MAIKLLGSESTASYLSVFNESGVAEDQTPSMPVKPPPDYPTAPDPITRNLVASQALFPVRSLPQSPFSLKPSIPGPNQVTRLAGTPPNSLTVLPPSIGQAGLSAQFAALKAMGAKSKTAT